jgi:hypothetical protein
MVVSMHDAKSNLSQLKGRLTLPDDPDLPLPEEVVRSFEGS